MSADRKRRVIQSGLQFHGRTDDGFPGSFLLIIGVAALIIGQTS